MQLIYHFEGVESQSICLSTREITLWWNMAPHRKTKSWCCKRVFLSLTLGEAEKARKGFSFLTWSIWNLILVVKYIQLCNYAFLSALKIWWENIFRCSSISSTYPGQSPVRRLVGDTFGFPFCQCQRLWDDIVLTDMTVTWWPPLRLTWRWPT